jgi:hypothetical protein
MPLATYPTNLEQISTGVSQGAYDMARQQFDTAQQNEQLNQQKALQDYLFSEQENPLKLEKSRLDNTGQGLLNRQNATKATFGEQTLQSDVDSKNSTNRVQLTADQVKQTGLLANHLNQLADMVDSGIPLLAIADRLPPDLAQALSQNGGTARVRQMAKNMSLHSQEQYQKMQEVDANNKAANARSDYTADKHLEGIKYSTDNKKFAPKGYTMSLSDQFRKSDTPQKRLTISGSALTDAQYRFDNAESEEEKVAAQKEVQYWGSQNSAAQHDYEVELANKFKSQVDLGGLPGSNIPMTAPPKFGNTKKLQDGTSVTTDPQTGKIIIH